jgi:signal transduction histidine kinase
LESAFLSLTYLDQKDSAHHDGISTSYHELARSSMHLKNFDSALKYYDLAVKFAPDEGSVSLYLNSKAVAFQQLKKYALAVSLYESIINKKHLNPTEYARVLSNLAKSKWLNDKTYNASPELMKSLQIRIDNNDSLGLNASYSHLSDYYLDTHPDSALYFARKMDVVARNLGNPDDRLEALSRLAQLNTEKLAKRYFAEYTELNDSVLTARAKAKNQFAVIRYQAEESKAKNLELEKQVSEHRLLLFGAIFVLAFSGITAVRWYKKRQSRMAAAAQELIRQQELKTSQKVHDVVANGLYRIMKTIEHRESTDKETLLDDLEMLYEQSRDISYESTSTSKKSFQQIIASLLTSFATDNTKVSVVGNSPDLWTGLSVDSQNEIAKILQELMVNMAKHSGAKNVSIRFVKQNGSVTIKYTDDGVGLPSSVKFGNGLTNTENRINRLKGQLNFETSPAKGLRIEISFPTNLT